MKKALIVLSMSCISMAALSQPQSPYSVQEFSSGFHKYHVGDVAPDLFFTKEYIINEWNIRHLPKPQAGAHWTYMEGTYVLLNEKSHKIAMALDSDIFYKKMD